MFRRKPKKQDAPATDTAHSAPAPTAPDEADSPADGIPVSGETASATQEPRSGFIARFRARLNRGDSWLTYDLANLIPGREIDEDVLEELETRMLTADVGVATTEQIMSGLSGKVQRKELADLPALVGALREAIVQIIGPCAVALEIPPRPRPFVILVVGVNGAGKTTTIGKLAKRLQGQGLSVMLAAGDTFRAAAVEQLQAWGERNQVQVVAQASGADPAAVVFDALEAARARGVDVLLADTAGRLHTQAGLMDELKKVQRVMRKLDPDAPHETLLVLDGGAGQNAVNQARHFHEAVGVSGIAITKLDGSAKGGTLLAIAGELGLPIRFVGVGESIDDLGPFNAEAFADALLQGGDSTAQPQPGQAG